MSRRFYSYDDLTFRPLGPDWPGQRNRYPDRSRFGSTYTATRDLLVRELRALDAELVVLQIDLDESQLRLDGKPRAGSRPPDFAGVILSFESRHGPIQFAVDTFPTWQENLRAIALAMEALRKVDRYGVTKHGEQYTGWKALPAGGGSFASSVEARAYLDGFGGLSAALKQTHPDRGGDRDDFAKVMEAKAMVGA